LIDAGESKIHAHYSTALINFVVAMDHVTMFACITLNSFGD
jgi:hypothetical protein